MLDLPIEIGKDDATLNTEAKTDRIRRCSPKCG